MRLTKLSVPALILFLACNGAARAEECVYKPYIHSALMEVPGSVPITHGINLSGWWQDEPNKSVSTDEIRHLRDHGFDFVRLPINPGWMEIRDSDEQQKRMDALRCDIISILNQDVSIVIDLHAPDSYQEALSRDSNLAVPKIESAWRKIAPLLEGLPTHRIMISVYNEPLIETEIWWRMQERIIEDLRRLFPDNTIIASSGPFNGWWNLVEKKPYRDLNIIYDFHFYDPVVFTHHSANWVSKAEANTKPPKPIVYPFTPGFNYDADDPDVKKYVDAAWDKTAITKIIESIAAWRDYYRVRVVCMEFGVYRPYVDDQSRYAWLHDVHTALDGVRMPWAIWEYKGPFGLLDFQGTLDHGMIHALDLSQTVLP